MRRSKLLPHSRRGRGRLLPSPSSYSLRPPVSAFSLSAFCFVASRATCAGSAAGGEGSDKNLLPARPPVLSAARVKENCFSLSFIVAPSCETWRRVSTSNKCRVFGGFAPAPEAWSGGSGRAARQCASSSATGGQTGPEEVGAGQKPAFKPAWKQRISVG